MDKHFKAKFSTATGKPTKKPKVKLYMPLETALELYDLWTASNYVALPFSGALLEQPYYVRKDFAMLSQHEAWFRPVPPKERGRGKPAPRVRPE